MMLFAVLAFASCDELTDDKDKEPTFSDYFQMKITNCERVGDNLQVNFTLKNVSGENLPQVQLNGVSAFDMCQDNLGNTYYSDISFGSNWMGTVRTSMSKGETITGSFLIKNFNASSKANKLNLIFGCSCSALNFNGRGEIDKINIRDNRILSNGICTNDLALAYTLEKVQKKTINGKSVVDITFSVQNNTGEDLQNFQISAGSFSSYPQDNTGKQYYNSEISFDGYTFKGAVSCKLLDSNSQQYTFRLYDVNSKATTFDFKLACSATDYPFGNGTVDFYDIPVTYQSN